MRQALWLALLLAAQLQADPPALRWAGDSEGGAPFIYQDPTDPKRLIGAEVELLELLAQRLGRPASFVQNSWDGLIPGLDRGDYEVACNAIEITPERSRKVTFTRPYFITYAQLAVRKDEQAIRGVEGLKGKRVGTYKGAQAQAMLEAMGYKPVLYEAIDPMYRDLGFKRLDAVLLDQPIALYVGGPLPDVRFVGGPVGRLEYGIAVTKKDPSLKAQLDAAIDELERSGELRRLWQRWGIWNPRMPAGEGPDAAPVAYAAYLEQRGVTLGWQEQAKRYLLDYAPLLARGAWITLQLSVAGMLLAMSLGLLVALARVYGPWPLRWLALAWVELLRGTPLLIQLFILFYGLPHAGVRLAPWLAAVIGLGLNYSAYEAENYRAGLQSVPKGQTEAALALGLSRWQALRHVVLPQALRVILPPVTNDFISILKDSSLVSVITMVELTKVYGQLASTYYDWLGLGLLTAAMYFLIGLPFVWMARVVEKKMRAPA